MPSIGVRRRLPVTARRATRGPRPATGVGLRCSTGHLVDWAALEARRTPTTQGSRRVTRADVRRRRAHQPAVRRVAPLARARVEFEVDRAGTNGSSRPECAPRPSTGWRATGCRCSSGTENHGFAPRSATSRSRTATGDVVVFLDTRHAAVPPGWLAPLRRRPESRTTCSARSRCCSAPGRASIAVPPGCALPHAAAGCRTTVPTRAVPRRGRATASRGSARSTPLDRGRRVSRSRYPDAVAGCAASTRSSPTAWTDVDLCHGGCGEPARTATLPRPGAATARGAPRVAEPGSPRPEHLADRTVYLDRVAAAWSAPARDEPAQRDLGPARSGREYGRRAWSTTTSGTAAARRTAAAADPAAGAGPRGPAPGHRDAPAALGDQERRAGRTRAASAGATPTSRASLAAALRDHGQEVVVDRRPEWDRPTGRHDDVVLGAARAWSATTPAPSRCRCCG